MSADTPVELPPDYYLKNFEQLCQQVKRQYFDLLSTEERRWLQYFENVSPEARKLYVRLLTRTGPAVLLAKINYQEISNLQAALEALTKVELARLNDTAITMEQWLPKLTVAQLRQLTAELAITLPSSKINKAFLITELTQFSDQTLLRHKLATVHPQVSLLGLEHMQSFRLLFFGNLYQDMSEFIVSELGHIRYESYPLDKKSRSFDQRSHIDQMLDYARLGEHIDEHIAQADSGELQLWFSKLAIPQDHLRLRRRHQKLVNKLARQMERLTEPEQALQMYQSSQLPPSRERQCRILVKLERHEQAQALLSQIKAHPITEPEAEFAEKFRYRLSRSKPRRFQPTQREWPVGSLDQGPEADALMHYQKLGYQGAHVENTLFNSLFGLAFWDICFAPLSGVFHHPFQRGPSDTLEPGFYQRRQFDIDQRLQEVRDGNKWQDMLWQHWQHKNGVANYFVNWQWPEQDFIKQALAVIPGPDLAAVFQRLARDVRHNRSGLPDLFLWRENEYLLVEVKGPGDTLQDNQLAWLRYFGEHGIPAEIAWLRHVKA